ncbi:MAG: CDP-glycerol glycerophosphotransferase family protein [Spirochaetales bacterium]|nr:CDP-glycerol glycerophosphotransferase family protein [Spirochaetales bacterium]
MKRSRIFFNLALLMVIPSPLFAYIDPMSGSTILYVLFALAATLFYSVAGLFYRFKNMMAGRGFSTQTSFDKTDIVFFSEGKQYWNVYLPVIKALEKREIKSAYVTADPADAALSYNSPFLEVKALGSMNSALAFMNQLKAPVVVTTTPQLDIFTFKRSKNVRHYAHILHSPTDTHTYRQFAFDYFDSVLCSGPYQIKSIRETEKKRGTAPKKLLETGLTYYDIMMGETETVSPGSGRRPSILVAPTWQPYSILNRFGVDFFKSLLSDDYKVIFRPHPQSFVSFPELVKEVMDEFKDNENFALDDRPSGSQSMGESSLMISDLSGVIYDYLFLYEKPVILMDTDLNRDGMEAWDLDHEMWDKTLCRAAGKTISEDDIPHLPSIVRDFLHNPRKGEIEKIRREALYNFGHAGETAAAQLLDIAEELKC